MILSEHENSFISSFPIYGFLFLALLIGWNLKYIVGKEVVSECGHSAVHLILEKVFSLSLSTDVSCSKGDQLSRFRWTEGFAGMYTFSAKTGMCVCVCGAKSLQSCV